MAFRPPSIAADPSVEGSVPVRTLVKEDKWKLVSHLQKAVRRGLPDAAQWAAQELERLDPAYLRYRMSVIAVEEVGGGSPEVVAEVMGAGWTKAIIEARGGGPFVIAAARTFAQSVKDRTPCTWMGCTQWRTPFEQTFGPWERLPRGQALDIAFDPQQPWWAQGLAAWRFIGTERFGTDHLPKVSGDWEGWQDRVREEGWGEAYEHALAAGAHQREAHPVFLALAWAAQKREQAQVQALPLLDLGYAGPWLSSALDKHTSEGKKALGLLLRPPSAGKAWLEEHGAVEEQAADAIGRLWFWMEGGQVNQGQVYPTGQAIERALKQRFLERRGWSGRAFYEQWGTDPSAWHEARLQVLGLAPQPSRRWRY